MRKFWLSIYFWNAVMSGIAAFGLIVMVIGVLTGIYTAWSDAIYWILTLILCMPSWYELHQFDRTKKRKAKRGYVA